MVIHHKDIWVHILFTKKYGEKEQNISWWEQICYGLLHVSDCWLWRNSFLTLGHFVDECKMLLCGLFISHATINKDDWETQIWRNLRPDERLNAFYVVDCAKDKGDSTSLPSDSTDSIMCQVPKILLIVLPNAIVPSVQYQPQPRHALF